MCKVLFCFTPSNNDTVACEARQLKFWRFSLHSCSRAGQVQYARFAIIGTGENIHAVPGGIFSIYTYIYIYIWVPSGCQIFLLVFTGSRPDTAYLHTHLAHFTWSCPQTLAQWPYPSNVVLEDTFGNADLR